MAMYGHIYHCLGAFVPPQEVYPCFLSVYIQDTEFLTQENTSGQATSIVSESVMNYFTAILHGVKYYISSLESILEGYVAY